LLAHLDATELNDIVRQHGLAGRTRRTITSIDVLRDHLAQVREHGFAIDDEESCAGLKCVAAPVFNHEHQIVAALSVSGSASEFGEDRLPGLIEAVVRAARALSVRLGMNAVAACSADADGRDGVPEGRAAQRR
jgi:DNA-binding IclR family transcriptional regulator